MERKWVHFLFAAGGIVLLVLLIKTGDWIWSYFGKPKTLILYSASFVVTLAAVYIAWRSEELFTLASEVVTELGKVTWPTRKETMAATLVVIVTVIIASIFLGMFDGIWSFLTRLLYG
jgi:preprotein translocase subunit SecE